MNTDSFTPSNNERLRQLFKQSRAVFALVVFIGFALPLVGCAPPVATDGEIPELTDETILERINGTRVRKVPEENGAGEPINWTFDHDEPKEIRVVERQTEDDGATTLLLDIKTGSAPNSRDNRHLAGQIRTKWRLETGLVLRRWEIEKIENVSMKYKNLPKPIASNSNR